MEGVRRSRKKPLVGRSFLPVSGFDGSAWEWKESINAELCWEVRPLYSGIVLKARTNEAVRD